VTAQKQVDGKDRHVVGSSELMHTLIEHGLVDEFRLMIDPVIVGGGSRSSAMTVCSGRSGSSRGR